MYKRQVEDATRRRAAREMRFLTWNVTTRSNADRQEVRYAVRKPDGTIETRVVENVRKAEVNVKQTGEVVITTRRWGVGLEPGFGFTVDRGLRPYGDIQFFYAGPWGMNAGLYWNRNLRMVFSGSYSLAKISLANVSVWAGGNLQKDLVFGLRVCLN